MGIAGGEIAGGEIPRIISNGDLRRSACLLLLCVNYIMCTDWGQSSGCEAQ
jgi:hypothetical protein